jgi:hypothetical protein
LQDIESNEVESSENEFTDSFGNLRREAKNVISGSVFDTWNSLPKNTVIILKLLTQK